MTGLVSIQFFLSLSFLLCWLNILPRIGVPSGGDTKMEDTTSVQFNVNVGYSQKSYLSLELGHQNQIVKSMHDLLRGGSEICLQRKITLNTSQLLVSQRNRAVEEAVLSLLFPLLLTFDISRKGLQRFINRVEDAQGLGMCSIMAVTGVKRQSNIRPGDIGQTSGK